MLLEVRTLFISTSRNTTRARQFLQFNAPINGLPQDGGVGQPRGIRLRKAHMSWDFDITAIPRVGNLTRPPS